MTDRQRVRRGDGRERALDAAYRLFLEQGYDGTTLREVAAAAGVAEQTIYYLFGSKEQLLRETESRWVLGGTPLTTWRDAPWAGELLAETDPRALIARFVLVDGQIKKRLATWTVAVGRASPPSPQNFHGRDEFFAFLVDRTADLAEGNRTMARERTIDAVRVLNSLENYIELTTRRMWSDDEWAEWITAALSWLLIDG
ncbi:helix-turn-helix domain-containing protein [Microbacterium panaciterrae]|uniref:HTH tetR-type domain-containing protein n=1 Tax=Microbacterium panaciterrae TaxID=985759 RepID=A0ABP8PLJ9_9MICO